MLILIRRTQLGMTLIELMVAMTIGLIVVGAVMAVYLVTLRSSGDTVGQAHLNQEVSAILTIMANDIRRAGYGNAAGPDWDNPNPATGVNDPNDRLNIEEPSTNPFNQRGSTALEVHNGADVNQGVTGSGECIVFAYDRDLDGVLGLNESLGFRLRADLGAIQMRQGIDAGEATNSCSTNGNKWATMNDERTVEITSVTFDLANSGCVNTLEPDLVDNDNDGVVDDLEERDCYTHDPATAPLRGTYRAPPETVPVVEVRHVEITITAQLRTNNPDEKFKVRTTQRTRVAVRNNLARLIP